MRAHSGRWSLRRNLLLIAFITAITAWGAGSAAMYWSAAREDAIQFDARLKELAAMVDYFADDEIREMASERRADRVHSESLLNPHSRYRYQVWSNDGELLLYSANASATEPLMPLSSTGYITIHNGGEFRAFAAPTTVGHMLIQVSEHVDARNHVVAAFGSLFFVFVLISLGFIGLLSWWLVHIALRSIEATATQLTERNPLDLTELRDENPPEELWPMISAVNRLMRRVEQAMSSQRKFVSVAAHEMRTPLAGLRAYAQVAVAAQNEAERELALVELIGGVDRAAYLLEQLLDLAHVDSLIGEPQVGAVVRGTVRLDEAFQAVMADLGPLAAKGGLQLDTRFEATEVKGSEFAISALMRNLLRNAFAYAPEHSTVSVTCLQAVDGLTLTVDDEGPGIPAHERARVFERFYRLGGRQVEGIGLGLSIVETVATAHHATVRLLDSPAGGLRVQVHFPAGPDTALSVDHLTPAEAAKAFAA